MPPLHSLIAFALASLVLLVIPGPAVIYILNRSVADGRRMGLAAVCGLEIGNFMHVIAATAGLSAVLATSAAAFATVKWLGAGYLIYVGIHTLTQKPTALDTVTTQTSLRRSFVQGVVVNTLNPKVALFFLSFLPQFIDTSNGSPALQSFIFGSIFVLLGFLSDGAYAFVASGLRDTLLRGRTLPFVQRYVAGIVFIALGLVAGSTSRN
jgi:threonine/homoserine/homoserine lactone efflux protein